MFQVQKCGGTTQVTAEIPLGPMESEYNNPNYLQDYWAAQALAKKEFPPGMQLYSHIPQTLPVQRKQLEEALGPFGDFTEDVWRVIENVHMSCTHNTINPATVGWMIFSEEEPDIEVPGTHTKVMIYYGNKKQSSWNSFYFPCFVEGTRFHFYSPTVTNDGAFYTTGHFDRFVFDLTMQRGIEDGTVEWEESEEEPSDDEEPAAGCAPPTGAFDGYGSDPDDPETFSYLLKHQLHLGPDLQPLRNEFPSFY